MRFLAVSVVAMLASMVTSLDISGIPSCATSCITSNLGGCSEADTSCICNNKPLIAGLSCCVSKNCDAADQKKIINFAKGICGNNANIPSQAGCAAAKSLSSSAAASTATGNAAASNRLFEGAGVGIVVAGLAAAAL